MDFSEFNIKPVEDKDVMAEYNEMLKNIEDVSEDQVTSALESVLLQDQVANINLSKKDMDDPILQRELQALGLGDFSTDVLNGAVDEKEEDIQVTEEDLKNEAFLAELNGLTQQESLSDQINREKKNALELKRMGDVTGAIEAMRRLKTLEVKYQKEQEAEKAMQQQITKEITDRAIHKADQVLLASQERAMEEDQIEVTEEDLMDPAFADELAMLDRNELKVNKPVVDDSSMLLDEFDMPDRDEFDMTNGGETEVDNVLHEPKKQKAVVAHGSVVLENKVQTDSYTDTTMMLARCKMEAIQHKRDGDITAALDSMRRVKELQTKLQQVASGDDGQDVGGMDAPQLQKQIQMKKQSALRLKKEGKKKEALAAMKRMKQLQANLQTLENSETKDSLTRSAWTELEQKLIEFANKAMVSAKELANVDRSRAKARVQERKYYQQELEKLREAKGNEFQQPPPCHIEIDQEKFEIVQHELREDEMELTIESLTGLTKYTNKGMYISFTTGVPSENPISCISTTSQGGPDFLFQFSNRLPLSRTRGTIKSFEIRKASFEVYRVRSLLRSPELIGKAFQPLKVLLSDSEIFTVLPLVDANRRAVGGELKIALRIRTPLETAKYEEIAHERLVVGSYPKLEAKVNQAVMLPPPVIVRRNSNIEPEIPNAIPREELDDPHNVDFIVSYDVMDLELSFVSDMLSNPRITPTDREDMELRQQSLELKKQMLEIEMQSGQLTLPLYLERILPRLAADKKLALHFKKEARKSDAARVFRRYKAMSKEVQGATDGQ